ncbi:hypothetical protein K5I29_12040 [Flavobacterium agricola]|uniref:Lipoprotein n=1 Tax=Flavobacterium agricola TaxID=2870839 RepID=A0ABY6LXV8_9FLAO|nr:hypothetical protein [Flavobacterium agricola]UYW01173.1 hypothetical protein K5I29_12040 [Flavobacterium agricola]
MKKIFGVFCILLFATSCDTVKTFLDTKEGLDYKTKIKSDCPSDGTCELMVFKNSSLQIQSDGLGQSFYDMVFDSEKTVIMYEYKRNNENNFQDGDLTERIVFEVRNNVTEFVVEDLELSNLVMFYERHCFCKGETGLFPINKGKLYVNNVGNALEIKIDIEDVDIPFSISYLEAQIK